ncbi:MAG: cytochrome P450 [Candidatus Poriferisodalaceae bacterium]|jgi:cytochrome P450|tara:strand:+ start:782 stop:2035 length:1254 start_codon:yes stop_codon:yes gene_type:complete
MNTPNRPDVTDWANDFDPYHPEYLTDPYPIWKDIRESGCPIAHTDRFNGVYLPTKHEDISAIAHDTENFSSKSVIITDVRVEDIGSFSSPPITSDPPDHQDHRRVLLPAFSAKAIEKWLPITRDICNELLDEFAENGSCDASESYAKHIPVKVIARMIGIPEEDGDMFRRWVYELLEAGPTDVKLATKATYEVFEYFGTFIESRRNDPRDDILTYLLEADMNGKPLDDRQISGGLFLLLLAGIDTTWGTIGSSILHLSQNTEDRRRLVNDPEAMDNAVEEFLRFYSPVSMARVVTNEVEISGTTLCPGQRVMLPFASANRDPEFLADAEEFQISREVNRHSAFGLGIHRCLGSNLARMEIKVALEEWLKRVPEFELTDSNKVTWAGGPVRGPRSIPLTWETSQENPVKGNSAPAESN